MNSANAASAYQTQQLMTAPPEKITLMLYNGAIRFVTESIMALDAGNSELSKQKNIKAQNIMYEFIKTFDMNYEVSRQWAEYYRYIIECLIQGYEKQNRDKMEEAKDLIRSFRDTWVEVMKKVNQEKAASGHGGM